MCDGVLYVFCEVCDGGVYFWVFDYGSCGVYFGCLIRVVRFFSVYDVVVGFVLCRGRDVWGFDVGEVCFDEVLDVWDDVGVCDGDVVEDECCCGVFCWCVVEVVVDVWFGVVGVEGGFECVEGEFLFCVFFGYDVECDGFV